MPVWSLPTAVLIILPATPLQPHHMPQLHTITRNTVTTSHTNFLPCLSFLRDDDNICHSNRTRAFPTQAGATAQFNGMPHGHHLSNNFYKKFIYPRFRKPQFNLPFAMLPSLPRRNCTVSTTLLVVLVRGQECLGKWKNLLCPSSAASCLCFDGE